ncbi:MAG: hypothetical protein IKT98_02270 [Selenomonadaceae bacterium]|nr:hypothetical protein [Selenomonadaceae bacterium]
MSIEIISAEELEVYLKIGMVLHYEGTEELEYLIENYITTGEKPDEEKLAPKIEKNPLTQ